MIRAVLTAALSPNPVGGMASIMSPANQAIRTDALLELADEWQDQVAEAAIAGNPARAGYIEFMVREMRAGALG